MIPCLIHSRTKSFAEFDAPLARRPDRPQRCSSEGYFSLLFFSPVRKANMLRTRRKTCPLSPEMPVRFCSVLYPFFFAFFFFGKEYCESRGRKKRAGCALPSTRHGDSPRFATLWKPGISLLILLRNACSSGAGWVRATMSNDAWRTKSRERRRKTKEEEGKERVARRKDPQGPSPMIPDRCSVLADRSEDERKRVCGCNVPLTECEGLRQCVIARLYVPPFRRQA